jgi:hypothetical protein
MNLISFKGENKEILRNNNRLKPTGERCEISLAKR